MKTITGSKEGWLSYSIAFKIEVMNYAEKHAQWMMNKLYYGC